MSDLERFWLGDDEYGDPALVPASDGDWVRFSDVQEREARFQARIEELEGIVSGKTQFDRAAAVRAAWRERIEGLAAEWEEAKPRFKGDAQANQLIYEFICDLWALLLDSGEEQECPACRDWEIRGCIRCHGSGRASTPSPAFHREGREQFCPEKTQKNWTTDGRSAPVAVPEKVEARLKAAEALADAVERVGALLILDGLEPAMLDGISGPLAAFRATEEDFDE